MKKIFILAISAFLLVGCSSGTTNVESGKVVAKFSEPSYIYYQYDRYGSYEKKSEEKYFLCLQGMIEERIKTNIVEVNKQTWDLTQVDTFYINTTGRP